jgi:hypothetical protein
MKKGFKLIIYNGNYFILKGDGREWYINNKKEN